MRMVTIFGGVKVPVMRAILILCFCLDSDLSALESGKETPFVIHQIVGHPTHKEEVFAITSNYGVLKSEDAGLTWKTANHGLRSFTHHALAVTFTKLYAGGWGGGISKSGDDAETWVEMNDRLGNTAIDAIAVDPGSPDRLYIAASTQFYRTADSGKGWVSFGEGLPPFPDEIKFKSLVISPGPPKTLWYGNSQGLFQRAIHAPRWSAEEKFRDTRVSALAYDENKRVLWVGTLAKGLFTREDKKKEWNEMKIEKGLWINQIVLDPSDSRVLYLSTRGRGILKSTDGGKSWKPSNNGLNDQDIRSLAIHPLNRFLLFAGTTSNGIFRSVDGGAQWYPVKPMPSFTITEILSLLSNSSPSTQKPPAVPEAFLKCNACHGWTDSALSRKQTYWRVPPNQRDWKYTVGRMAKRARLTKQEESVVVNFLTAYSHQPPHAQRTP
ncbi:MAG: hypothetical protein HYR79_03235 [Nitrospirae bacterium]|nr:hypothetical protein [Nitrospirota bacterium]